MPGVGRGERAHAAGRAARARLPHPSPGRRPGRGGAVQPRQRQDARQAHGRGRPGDLARLPVHGRARGGPGRQPGDRGLLRAAAPGGKPEKVALAACMRKLVVTLNAVLRTGTAWNHELTANTVVTQEAYASQNQVAMEQALASSSWRANAVSLSKVIEARQPRVEPPKDRHHDGHGLRGRLAGQPGGEHEAGLPLLEDQHRPRPPADQQVTLPVPGVLPLLDVRGPVVDGAPPGHGAAGLPAPPPAAPGPPARQQLPELLALLPRAVDEGVDRLDRHPTKPALLAALEPAGDLLRRPALQQALANEPAEPLVALQERPAAGAARGSSPRRAPADRRLWAARSAAARGSSSRPPGRAPRRAPAGSAPRP